MSTNDNPAAESALAVAKHIETLLPSVAELTAALPSAEGRLGDLGPTVTLPAVYVRIVTEALHAEVLSRENAAARARIARAEQKPDASLGEEEFDALAVHLANEAVALSFLPLEGASALWKAAAMVAMVHTPSGVALHALDEMHAVTRADVAQALGMGATKQ
ncbi:hypothetical protein [Novosphingobium resinovorum]|uniref:hypothetical protein n=1 Tax=Novosphingobium resinovorum TaxID=158500 RepID=UPI002ED347C1|nr:hypothetical protein [Novosphingobium resinovorum]